MKVWNNIQQTDPHVQSDRLVTPCGISTDGLGQISKDKNCIIVD